MLQRTITKALGEKTIADIPIDQSDRAEYRLPPNFVFVTKLKIRRASFSFYLTRSKI